MKNAFKRIVVAVYAVCVVFEVSARQKSWVAADNDLELLFMQLAMRVNESSNIIARLERENIEIEKDRKEFFKTLNSIKVPEWKIVTNVTSYASGAVVKKVEKLPFKQEARVRKLIATMRNPIVGELYEKYCGASCMELLDEFLGEWKMAEEGLKDTMRMMENNSKAYTITTREIDDNAQKKYDDEMASFDADISVLKEKISLLERERQQLVEERMQKKQKSNPPRVAEIDSIIKDFNRDIKDIELERNAVVRIYKNNSFTTSYAAAGNRKMDANDAVLAEADLRNQHQNIYMTYSNRLKGDIIGVMASKILSNKAEILAKRKELNKLNFLMMHPDLIASDIAEAIIKGQVKEAIESVFGVDVDGLKSANSTKAMDTTP
jgi:ribosomal protein L23